MIPEADIIFSEQTIPPTGMVCSSGHVAAKTFKREVLGKPETTRWYEVTKIERVFGKRTPNSLGTFCEPCIVLAKYVADVKKNQENGTDIDPETVLRNKLQRKD